MIILIASVNIANLLLARAAGRQREIAVRLALGACRRRIIRQMLTESVMLSFIAGIAGVLTASATLSFILRFVPSGIPRLNEVSVDWVVLGFALLISVLTGIAFGLAPAIQAVKTIIFATIREGARGSGYGKKAGRLRDLLIVSEVALAVVLMVGAGLLLRTFWVLLQQDPGFNPSNVVSASIWLPTPNDPKSNPYAGNEPKNAFVREVLRRVVAYPGIEIAGITSALPASDPVNNSPLTIEDRPDESAKGLTAEVIRVSPDYFKVMQASLLQGRYFTETDESGKQDVAIIDETMAHRYWPKQEALGKRLKFGQGGNAPWITVIGVIKDIKHDGLDSDGIPHVYASIYQRPSQVMSVVLRSTLPVSTLEPVIRREIQAIDPNLPVFNIRTMNEVINTSLAPRRFSAELVGVFSALALLLASIGIYGLLAYMVGQRAQEIGIRVALGAQPSAIRRMVLGKGALLAGVGVSLGMLFAAITTPLITALLYGVRLMDPMVFLTVPLLLIAVALLASYIPARRATRVDPIIALREG